MVKSNPLARQIKARQATAMFRKLLSISLLIGIFWITAALAQSSPEEVFFEKDRLVIETLEGKRFAFTIELAITPKQQARGLMYRRGMAADSGMLFITDTPREISMWMKNTFIPLDMLFVDGQGVIVKIASGTVPHSLETVASGQAVKAVLEINAGVSEQLGITEGSQLLFPTFE